MTRLLWSNEAGLEWGLQQAEEDLFAPDERCPYEAPGGGFHFERDADMYVAILHAHSLHAHSHSPPQVHYCEGASGGEVEGDRVRERR